MNQYLQILQQSNAKTLEECIEVLIISGLNTLNDNDIIIKTIGVYLRDMIIPRLRVTPTRTFVSVLCGAMKFPDDVIIDCLQHMSDDCIIEFSDDLNYVTWIGPDPISGLWNNAYLSTMNMVVWSALLRHAEENTNSNGK